MTKRILILGCDGFIGYHLVKAILERCDWLLFGMDISATKIHSLVDNQRFHFYQGDITEHTDWVDRHISSCDVILPLVAIARPAVYINDPLRVFELDFEANLAIIRKCVAYKKHVVFPSTSEVYGMSTDEQFDEQSSNCVLGPIHKQRWIYSCSKQLLDRVIFAYGAQQGLSFTLFRPFNWFGAKLDDDLTATTSSSRVVTQFIYNVVHGLPIALVNGGMQRRCFCYIDDGIDALIRIIDNKDGAAIGRIFNIGSPQNELSIKALAQQVITTMQQYPTVSKLAKHTQITSVCADNFYGSGYQDITARVPSIANARRYLQWQPVVDFASGLRKTLDDYLTDIKLPVVVGES